MAARPAATCSRRLTVDGRVCRARPRPSSKVFYRRAGRHSLAERGHSCPPGRPNCFRVGQTRLQLSARSPGTVGPPPTDRLGARRGSAGPLVARRLCAADGLTPSMDVRCSDEGRRKCRGLPRPSSGWSRCARPRSVRRRRSGDGVGGRGAYADWLWLSGDRIAAHQGREIAGARRNEQDTLGHSPEVPTIGHPAILGDSWVASWFPTERPRMSSRGSTGEIVAIMEGDMAARLEALGYEPIGSTL